jgi:hypothetical protein
VCPAWRDALKHSGLLVRLKLSPRGGGGDADEALREAVARVAPEALCELDVTCVDGLSLQALAGVLAAHRVPVLRASVGEGDGKTMELADVEALLRKLNRVPPSPLRAFHATTLHCTSSDGYALRRLLARAPPFGAARVERLHVRFPPNATSAMLQSVLLRGAAFLHAAAGFQLAPTEDLTPDALAACVAAHPWVTHLALRNAPLRNDDDDGGDDSLDALVDAVTAPRPAACPRFSTLALRTCRLTPACAPALARLLRSPGATLKALLIDETAHEEEGEHDAAFYSLLNAPAAAVLEGALRANSTLKHLALRGVDLWRVPAATAALLGALTAHRSVDTLELSQAADDAAGTGSAAAAAGAALAALVAANAPALHTLTLSDNPALGDEGLRPMLAALPANTHLRTLRIARSGLSTACARDALLPALHANAALQELQVCAGAAAAAAGAHDDDDAGGFKRQAEALVAGRTAAAE